MRLPLSFAVAAAAGSVAASRSELRQAATPKHELNFDDNETPLPIVVWHGLGDDFSGGAAEIVKETAEKIYQGTYVHVVSLGGSDPGADSRATFLGDVNTQLEAVCQELAADNILSTAPAIDAVGFSQGGQFLRAYIERCNNPPVRSLVTFGSQHNGISRAYKCEDSSWFCWMVYNGMKIGVWTNYAQTNLVPAQYYRDPADLESYIAHSHFLADINNEKEQRNETYAKHIASLAHFAMILFDDDETVVPFQSSWFEEVNGTEVVPLRERALYKEDWLGLQALDKKGGLHFLRNPGKHMAIDDEILDKVIKEYFGPSRSTTSDNHRDAIGDEL
jgi:palmitoyl-protein thioesterase